MNIGQRIKEEREELGMKGTVLARRLGVAPTSVYRWEAGEREPSMQMLERIAHELRVEPGDFFRPKAAAPSQSGQELRLEFTDRVGVSDEVRHDLRRVLVALHEHRVSIPQAEEQVLAVLSGIGAA